MSLRRTLLTTRRILEQLATIADPRTVVARPNCVNGSARVVLTNRPGASTRGPETARRVSLIVMFLVTSVITCERGPSELSSASSRCPDQGRFRRGYAIALGLSPGQSVLVSVLSTPGTGSPSGSTWRISAVALCAGLLGTAFGLALSAWPHEFRPFSSCRVHPAQLLSAVSSFLSASYRARCVPSPKCCQ